MAKSEATLQKEKNFKAEVEKYKKTTKPLYSAWGFPILTKLKDPDPDILLRKTQLAAQHAAYLLNIKDKMYALWPYKKTGINRSYFTGMSEIYCSFTTIAIATVQLHQPIWYKTETIKLPQGNFTYTHGKLSALEHVRSSLITQNAVAMTWPDEKGNVKLYIHKKSNWGRHILGDKSECDGLNHAALVGLKDWKVLAEYIKEAKKVKRDAVCAIVRAICQAESQQEFKQMEKKHA